MSPEYSIFTLINLFAGINATIIGSAFLRRKGSPKSIASNRFAGILFSVGYLLAIFTLANNSWISYDGVVKISHDFAALCLGALTLDYVRCIAKQKTLSKWGYLPALIYIVAATLWGKPFYGKFEILHLVVINLIYTITAVVVYVTWVYVRKTHSQSSSRIIGIECLLAATGLIYLLQLLRIILTENQYLFEVIPLLGACFIGLFFVSFVYSRPVLERFVAPMIKKPIAVKQNQIQDISAIITEQELFLDPTLTLLSLANQLNCKQRALSQYINDEIGCSYHTYINRFRIDRAKALLKSIAEKNTPIEVVAMLCGFRSRSVFYEAFRRETGQTPSQYRNKYHIP